MRKDQSTTWCLYLLCVAHLILSINGRVCAFEIDIFLGGSSGFVCVTEAIAPP
jgi:hypothetical protein